MKFKFNLKLTAFLVSLFLSLLLVILGSKNQYCLAFGFILMGISFGFFIWFNNEKIEIALQDTENQIDVLEDEENEYEELMGLSDNEREYMAQQLYFAQIKLQKKKKSTSIMFSICGVALIILGFIAMF